MGERFYQFDIGGLAGDPDAAEHGEGYYDGLHFDNLFDQDEDESGELVNPATGRHYDNSTYDDRGELTTYPEEWDEVTEAELEELAVNPEKLDALVRRLGQTASSRRRTQQLPESA